MAVVAPSARRTPEPQELIAARKRARLSLRQIAERMGVPTSTYHQWERARTPFPEDRLDALNAALAEPAPRPDPLQRALAHILQRVADEPGRMTIGELRTSMGAGPASEALDRAVAEQIVHTRPREAVSKAGKRYLRHELFPGAPPADVAPVEPAQAPNPEEIRAARTEAGWTQQELADRLGVAGTMVTHWETGRYAVAELQRERLRQVLGDARVAALSVQREKADWSIRELGERLGIPWQKIACWENGRPPAPEPERARILTLLAAEPRDRVEESVPRVVEAIERAPGRPETTVARGLTGADYRVFVEAIRRALRRKLVHRRAAAGQDRDGRWREHQGLFPGPRPAGYKPPAPVTTQELVDELERLGMTQVELAAAIGTTAANLRAWMLRGGVPLGLREPIRARLDELEPIELSDRERALREQLPAFIAEYPGLGRFELARRLPGARAGRLLGSAIAWALDEGQIHERPAIKGQTTVLGLFAGPAPEGWEPGPPVSPEELLAGLKRTGWTQQRLAEELGVHRSAVSMWCEGREPVPFGRRAQVRRTLAAAADAPAPMRGTEIKAGREALGWTQSELAHRLLLGVSSVNRWERDLARVPTLWAEEIRSLFRDPPTEPPAAGPIADELRAELERAGLDQYEAARLLGVSQATVSAWVLGRRALRGKRLEQVRWTLRELPDAPPAEDPGEPIVGLELWATRRKTRLSQRALAERLGVHQGSIRNWEATEVPTRRRSSVRALLGQLSAQGSLFDAGAAGVLPEPARGLPERSGKTPGKLPENGAAPPRGTPGDSPENSGTAPESSGTSRR